MSRRAARRLTRRLFTDAVRTPAVGHTAVHCPLSAVRCPLSGWGRTSLCHQHHPAARRQGTLPVARPGPRQARAGRPSLRFVKCAAPRWRCRRGTPPRAARGVFRRVFARRRRTRAGRRAAGNSRASAECRYRGLDRRVRLRRLANSDSPVGTDRSPRPAGHRSPVVTAPSRSPVTGRHRAPRHRTPVRG